MVRVFVEAESPTLQVKAFQMARYFKFYLHHYYDRNPWTSTLAFATELDTVDGAKYVDLSLSELKVIYQDVRSVTGKDVF
jgi:hypothetical protein